MVHLRRVLRAAALTPPEVKLLAAVSTYDGFKAWLAGAAGQATRRSLRWYAKDKYVWHPINDGDDIEQRGLIFLWKRWRDDPEWFRFLAARYVGKVAFTRGKHDRFHYRRGRGNTINTTLALLETEKGDETEKPDPMAMPDTHLSLRDRQTVKTDMRLDIQFAIQATIRELCAAEAQRPSNGHHAPVELIVQTIVTAFMYYAGQTLRQKKGTSSDGDLRYYWSQHITERQWYKWKPRVLTTMAKHLEQYAPVQVPKAL